MNLKSKIVLYTLLIGVVPSMFFLIFEYYSSYKRLETKTYDQLRSVREIKRRELEWYFKRVGEETNFIAKSSLVVNATKEFKSSFVEVSRFRFHDSLKINLKTYYENNFTELLKENDSVTIEYLLPKTNVEVLLQSVYLNITKEKFVPNPYHKVHEKHHSTLNSFIKNYNFYDLFIVDDSSGHIVYSSVKEIDFATNLLKGPFSNSAIGKLFRKTRTNGDKYSYHFSDFEFYLPSGYQPCAFVSSPIYDNDNKIGTLIMQVPINTIDEITTGKRIWKEEGFGETGEIYLVGPDFRLRSNSRFFLENPEKVRNSIFQNEKDTVFKNLSTKLNTSILLLKNQSESAKKGAQKLTGVEICEDYRKERVISAFAPITFNELQWTLLVEVDEKEVFDNLKKSAFFSIAYMVLFLFFIIVLSFYLSNSILNPIVKISDFVKSFKNNPNETNHSLLNINSKDEIGLVAQVLEETLKTLTEYQKEILNKNDELDAKNIELIAQTEELEKLNQQLFKLNHNLNKMVDERTQKLMEQNQNLYKYAHFNSHQLRGPVATLLGLVNIAKLNNGDLNPFLSQFEETLLKLDGIVKDIQNLLEQTYFDHQ